MEFDTSGAQENTNTPQTFLSLKSYLAMICHDALLRVTEEKTLKLLLQAMLLMILDDDAAAEKMSPDILLKFIRIILTCLTSLSFSVAVTVTAFEALSGFGGFVTGIESQVTLDIIRALCRYISRQVLHSMASLTSMTSLTQ